MNISEHRHPDSLGIYFLTEMWERYGYYVVQTLLILYLTYHFHWADSRAFELVGTFTAMTYISSLLGGWIADHLLGQKRAIIIATFILFISYAVLATLASRIGLLISLAGICVGTGLLKPNISSLLGNEYLIESPRRESGFTLFYIGITTGIILGSTVPNIIHQKFGWPMAFLSAAFGIVLAFIVFTYGIYRYKIADYSPYVHSLRKSVVALVLMLFLYFSALEIFDYPAIANTAFSIIIFLCIVYLIHAAKTAQGQQSNQNIVIGLLCIISALFWAFYFQMFSSFSLLITRIVDPTLFGIPFPAPYYVAVQSLGLVVFGILLARPRHHKNIAIQAINISKKFTMAMLLMAVAYAITVLILHLNLNPTLLSPLLIIPIYLTISIAELLLSPVGLAAITLLSSPKKVSTMMGIFFVSLGTGGFLSGKLATLAAVPSTDVPVQTLKIIYSVAFSKMLGLLILATLLCFCINGLIKNLLKNSK